MKTDAKYLYNFVNQELWYSKSDENRVFQHNLTSINIIEKQGNNRCLLTKKKQSLIKKQ